MNKKIIISWIFSLVLISIIISIIDLDQVIENMTKIGLINFVLLCLLYSVGYLFRALKWKAILHNLSDISFKDSFFIINIGFFINALLPARAGEIARAYLLSKKKNLGKIKSLSTVVLDRVVDGMILFLFFTFSLFFIQIPQEFKSIILIPATIFILGFLFFFKPEKFKFFGRIIIKIFPSLKGKIKYVFNEMKEAGNMFHSKKHVFQTIVYSILTWLIESFVFYFTAQTLGIELTFFQVVLLVVVVGFVVMIPSAPSYVGMFEAGFILFFIAFGLSENSAISMAIVIHLIQTVVVIILGLISMNQLNLSFKNISKINFSEIKNKIKGG